MEQQMERTLRELRVQVLTNFEVLPSVVVLKKIRDLLIAKNCPEDLLLAVLGSKLEMTYLPSNVDVLVDLYTDILLSMFAQFSATFGRNAALQQCSRLEFTLTA